MASGITENELNLEFIDINTSKHMQHLNLITNTVRVRKVVWNPSITGKKLLVMQCSQNG